MIKNVSVTHNFREGYIGAVASGMSVGGGTTAGALIKSAGFDNIIREGEKILIPKEIKLGFSLEVVHDHALGWDHNTGNWRGGHEAPGYPYRVGLVRDTQDGPTLNETGRIMEDTTPPSTSDTSPFNNTQANLDNAPGSPNAQQSSANSNVLINDTNADVGIEESNVQ